MELTCMKMYAEAFLESSQTSIWWRFFAKITKILYCRCSAGF